MTGTGLGGETGEPATSARRRRGFWLGLVAAVVATALVSLALLWSTTCLDCDGFPHPPGTSFAETPRWSVDNVTFEVSSMWEPRPLAEFNASLLRDASLVASLGTLADGARDGPLSFRDRDSDGRLSVGDTFSIDRILYGEYVLDIIYRSTLAVIERRTFEMPPSVGLGTWSPIGTGTWEVIVGSSPSRPLGEFAADLRRDGTTIGNITSLSSGASDGNLTFQDVGGVGMLSAGDRFVVTTPGPGEYRLDVHWKDILVASSTFSI